ncbi:MAG: RNA polymerase sporulation sigma factor SigK [Clostridia bacterium]|nr:RNA polymerase sporulation sigma factor SigK [Clostridia bacterium]
MLQGLLTLFSRFFGLFLRVSGVQSFPPPLPKDKERELFLRAHAGDAEARNTLIEHNLRLVAHIVKKYYLSYRDQEDLLSVGTIGLIKAIDSFDVQNGARFATYAGKCLQNEILMYFRAQKKHAQETSINEPVDVDKEGNPLTYLDVLSDDEDIIETLDTKIKHAGIYRAVREVLDEREKAVIVLRYGLTEEGKAYAQREVASRLGISRSYVSRIEKAALEKIKKYLGET